MTDDLTAEPNIPADWDSLSPKWMTAALARSFPGAEVGEVELVLRDDGTNRRGRFGLTYTRGAGPATVFLKAADPAHAEVNARMGGVFNEARLFRSGVPLSVDHPAVYLSLIDEPNVDFLMVMEDIAARGGDPRDSLRPLTVDQAANGARGLARLHSAYWGDRLTREGALAWVEPFRVWTGMAIGIDIGLKRAGDTIPAVVQELSGEDIEGDLWSKYLATVNDATPTLLHGDPHIGNTYVLPDDDVGFLDWQVLRRGSSSLDLGYFVQGALTIDDRRASEADLVDEYHQALELSDAERPSRAETWLRYRASVAHGLTMWLATAASNTWQRPEVSLALAQRYAAAFEDLDTPSAIDELTA